MSRDDSSRVEISEGLGIRRSESGQCGRRNGPRREVSWMSLVRSEQGVGSCIGECAEGGCSAVILCQSIAYNQMNLGNRNAQLLRASGKGPGTVNRVRRVLTMQQHEHGIR